MIEFKDLNNKKIDEVFPKVLKMLLDDAEYMETELKRELLMSLQVDLDYADEQDTFSTEGWRAIVGL